MIFFYAVGQARIFVFTAQRQSLYGVKANAELYITDKQRDTNHIKVLRLARKDKTITM